MPLGQVLIEEGVVTRGQLTAALQRQVDAGGRLGTNLIELRCATIDQIARALAQLHGVPAALERHLEARDPDLARAVPTDVAARWIAIPIATSRTGGIVVCMRDPTSAEAIAALRQATRREIIASVTPEIAIHRLLAKAYRIPLAPRFGGAAEGEAEADDESGDIDVDWTPPPPLAPGEYGFSDHIELVDLDHRAVARDDTQSRANIDVRRFGSSLDTGATPATVSGTFPIARGGPPAFVPARELAVPVRSYREAITALGIAGHKDDVADALMGFVRGVFASSVMLVVKDAMALGLRGFGGSFTSDTVESIVVPLSTPSLFKTTVDALKPFVGIAPIEREGNVQERFFKLFPPATGPRELALVPVSVRDRVVCLIYAHGRAGEVLFETAAAELVALAKTAGEAYLRILRAGKQR